MKTLPEGDSEFEYHLPVMVNEVLRAFELENIAPLNLGQVKPEDFDRQIIDATLGSGGHTLELLSRGIKVLGIETDKELYKIAKMRLETACPVPDNFRDWGPYKLHHGNFRDINKIAQTNGLKKVDGILADLGISSIHYELKRGFSFGGVNEELEMRLDPVNQAVTGYDLLNALSKHQLAEMFDDFISKNDSMRLSELIVEFRKNKKFRTVSDFVGVIEKTVKEKRKINKSTLPFMALRIFVNDEYGSLEEFIKYSIQLISEGGTLVIITFHSGEDRIVKQSFKKHVVSDKNSTHGVYKVASSEAKINPRSRSAKLRFLKINRQSQIKGFRIKIVNKNE